MSKTKSQEKLIEEARLDGMKEGFKIGMKYIKFKCDQEINDIEGIKKIINLCLKAKNKIGGDS